MNIVVKKCRRDERTNYFFHFDDLFTLIAFGAVAYGKFSGWFTIPFLILLAVVQVLFQLYYFMHMKEKGHESPAIFLYSGVLVASMTVLALMTVVWW